MKFQTLYKKNTQGKIEAWSIKVMPILPLKDNRGWRVTVIYGEFNGKQIEKSYDVKAGKNVGRKNGTSVREQANAEAFAKWEKKLKQGYAKTLKEAEAGKTDAIIKGGVVPMLAHDYDDHKGKIIFPVYAQPKLDGQRCVAIFDGKKVTLWTRSRKQIHSCPHIIEQLERMLKGFRKIGEKVTLDGELYCHKWRDDFEKIMSAVRKNKPSKESELIEFHMYDLIDDGTSPFRIRKNHLMQLPDFYMNVCHVETTLVQDERDLKKYHATCVRAGYEGAMIRNPEGFYEHKRSKNLLKFKTFIDAEYEIHSFIEGKDNTVIAQLYDHIGKTMFKATMMGDKKKNQKYLKGKYKGKLLTVKFFSYTNANKVPRFPVGVRVRDEL